MNHYAKYVSQQSLLPTQDPVGSLWKEVIPQEALQHGFLLHGLLALTALHLAHSHLLESSRYLSLFDRHQTIALAQYRDNIRTGITSDNSGAMYALAAIISMSSMARSCAIAASQSEPRAFSIEQIAEVLLLTTGVRDISSIAADHIKLTPMAALFDGHSMPHSQEARVILPAELRRHLDCVREMLQVQVGEPEVLKHCSEAFDSLVYIYHNTRYFSLVQDFRSSHVWRWTVRTI